MWKLFHYLFGWHYIVICEHHWIRRVRTAPNGQKYIRFIDEPLFINEDGTTETHNTWKPLTFTLEDKENI